MPAMIRSSLVLGEIGEDGNWAGSWTLMRSELAPDPSIFATWAASAFTQALAIAWACSGLLAFAEIRSSTVLVG